MLRTGRVAARPAVDVDDDLLPPDVIEVVPADAIRPTLNTVETRLARLRRELVQLTAQAEELEAQAEEARSATMASHRALTILEEVLARLDVTRDRVADRVAVARAEAGVFVADAAPNADDHGFDGHGFDGEIEPGWIEPEDVSALAPVGDDRDPFPGWDLPTVGGLAVEVEHDARTHLLSPPVADADEAPDAGSRAPVDDGRAPMDDDFWAERRPVPVAEGGGGLRIPTLDVLLPLVAVGIVLAVLLSWAG